MQTYDNGEVVRWIGAPDAEEPAPQVNVTPASAEGHGAADHDAADGQGTAAAATASDSADDGSGDGLAIAALIVGGLGLAAGGYALLRGRRRDAGSGAQTRERGAEA